MRALELGGSAIPHVVSQVGPVGTTRSSSRHSKQPPCPDLPESNGLTVGQLRFFEETDVLKDGLSGFPFMHSDVCEPICFGKETS
jgi:hypothetical protein